MIAIPLVLSPAVWVAATGLSLLTLPLARKRNSRNVSPGTFSTSNFGTRLDNIPIRCRLCAGQGQIRCTVCNETGVLLRGGFARRNTVRVSSLVGTKWTSVSAIDGKWRHFLCVEKKGRNAKNGIAVLSSTCGPVENRIRIEVPVSELKSRAIWEGGWTTLKDIRAGDSVPHTICSACRGEKKVMCPRCDGFGRMGI